MPATAERRRRLSLDKRRRETPEGCWEWTGSVHAVGYGQYRTPSANLYVHRMAYELLVGPIPDGQHLHHRCGNRLCFNPTHLVPLDQIEHNHSHASLTCIRCGASDWYRNAQGWRRCRPCSLRSHALT